MAREQPGNEQTERAVAAVPQIRTCSRASALSAALARCASRSLSTALACASWRDLGQDGMVLRGDHVDPALARRDARFENVGCDVVELGALNPPAFRLGALSTVSLRSSSSCGGSAPRRNRSGERARVAVSWN